MDVAGAVSYGVADNNTFGALYASLSCDGTELKTCNVAFGEAAEPPSDPERAGYKFIGWDGDYTYILKDVTITAIYGALPDYALPFIAAHKDQLPADALIWAGGAEGSWNTTDLTWVTVKGVPTQWTDGAKAVFPVDAEIELDGARSASIYDPYGYNGSKFIVLPGGVLETIGNFGIGCNGNEVVLQGGEWVQSYEYDADSGKYVVLKDVKLSDGAVISGNIGSMGYDYYNHDFTVKVQGDTPCAIELEELCLGNKNKAFGEGYTGNGCKSVFDVADVTGDAESDLVVDSDFSEVSGMSVAAGNESFFYLRKKGDGTLELTGDASSAPLCQFQMEAGTVKTEAATSAEFGTFNLKGDSTLDLTERGSLSFADSSAIDWTEGKTLDIVGDLHGPRLRFGTDANGLTAAQLASISYEGKFGKVFLSENGYLHTNDGTLILFR